MFPLLFIPGAETGGDDHDDEDVSYDLKCSEEFGSGAMNVTIVRTPEKRNIVEPVYNITINTVKV